jgi:DNA-binding winged helix-turn-helix (wHTH) protein
VTRLRPQTAAVLAYLLARPRAVVSKDELLREVWPNLVVTENSLVQCVREIRRELGDNQGVVVRTAPRRGYVLESGRPELSRRREA